MRRKCVRGAGVRPGCERDRELAAPDNRSLMSRTTTATRTRSGRTRRADGAGLRARRRRCGRHGCRKVWAKKDERGAEGGAEAVHEDGPDLHLHARRELAGAHAVVLDRAQTPRRARPPSRSTRATASPSTTTTPAWPSARTPLRTWHDRRDAGAARRPRDPPPQRFDRVLGLPERHAAPRSPALPGKSPACSPPRPRTGTTGGGPPIGGPPHVTPFTAGVCGGARESPPPTAGVRSGIVSAWGSERG